jgi:hypothetical protein
MSDVKTSEVGAKLAPANVHSFINSFTGAYSPGRTFDLPFWGFLITDKQTHVRTHLDE